MGALADEYEYLMQSSFVKGEASGYKKGEASTREEFINYWVGEVVRLVRTKCISVDEAVIEMHVRPEDMQTVSERSRAVLDRE
ncbi:MAG: hypothetical protein J5707_05780 [Candidatus Methanomethylophilus sp.]|nr:hypothetical protein [Methanomethylophilus sp.]